MEKVEGLQAEGKSKPRRKAFRQKRSLGPIMNRLLGAGLLVMLLALNVGADISRPILFVHGNGDSAALWVTTIWRFESNGYNPSFLYAIDFKHPTARDDDLKPQENRSSTNDQVKELMAKVSEIQARTGEKKVILIGSSRGGNAIRNYLKNFGGAANVSQAILCGTPNHGTRATPENLNNEFNGPRSRPGTWSSPSSNTKSREIKATI